jgi:hypothetical protein
MSEGQRNNPNTAHNQILTETVLVNSNSNNNHNNSSNNQHVAMVALLILMAIVLVHHHQHRKLKHVLTARNLIQMATALVQIRDRLVTVVAVILNNIKALKTKYVVHFM